MPLKIMMNWKEVTKVAIGLEMQYLPTALSAVLFCLLAMCLCFLMHRLTGSFLPISIKIYGLDYFKSVAFCTYPIGYGLTRVYHGHIGYGLIMIPINVFSLIIMPDGSISPVEQFLLFVQNKQTFFKTVLRILIQVTGAISAFYLAQQIMMLEFHADYKQIVSKACVSDLKISALTGFGLEMLGTFIEGWSYRQQWSRNIHLDMIVKSLTTVIIVSLGVHLTGMYMQPALASGYTFGCHGTSYMEHICVYWLGPFIGGWFGCKVAEKIHIPHYKIAPVRSDDGDQKKGKKRLSKKRN